MSGRGQSMYFVTDVEYKRCPFGYTFQRVDRYDEDRGEEARVIARISATIGG